MSLRKICGRGCATLAALATLAVSVPGHATSAQAMSIVDLLNHSQSIVAGRVEKVTDGFDAKGVPYTEITLKVMDMLRRATAGTHTIQQYALDPARALPDCR